MTLDLNRIQRCSVKHLAPHLGNAPQQPKKRPTYFPISPKGGPLTSYINLNTAHLLPHQPITRPTYYRNSPKPLSPPTHFGNTPHASMAANRKLQIPLTILRRRFIYSTRAPCPAYYTTSIRLLQHAPNSFSSLPDSSSPHFSTFHINKDINYYSVSFRNWFSTGDGVTLRCWSCDREAETVPFLFCEVCRSVQPVDHSVDYFEIFGLDEHYDIEVGSLEGKYKEWQKKLHPDLVHSKSQREKDYAAEQSARVIDAYRTLDSPLSRAVYMLKMKGVDVDEEQTISEPELLGEIMEIREAVEEAGDAQALTEIQIQIQEKLKTWAKCFAIAYQQQNFEEAKASIQRMTYYDRVNKEIVKRL